MLVYELNVLLGPFRLDVCALFFAGFDLHIGLNLLLLQLLFGNHQLCLQALIQLSDSLELSVHHLELLPAVVARWPTFLLSSWSDFISELEYFLFGLAPLIASVHGVWLAGAYLLEIFLLFFLTTLWAYSSLETLPFLVCLTAMEIAL